MKWRKALVASGAVGAAAALNSVLGRAAKPLENLIGGEEGWFEWRGRRVFYTRRAGRPGAADAASGTPLLLVHGIHAAAWSYEWRANVDSLADSRPVYTIDLLGFGMSDRPAIRYSARLYYNLISDFARQVIGAPCVLVAASLSAAFAAVLGARDPERFPALVLIEPTGLTRLAEPSDTGGELARLAFDMPVLGTSMFNALVSRTSLRYYLERVYANHDLVTDELIDAYYQTAHQPGARFAPAAFLAQQLNIDIRGAMRQLHQPVLLVWGEQALEVPVEDAYRFRRLKPDFELAVLDPAGSLPHDERPDDFNQAVRDFVERVAAGG
jgi:pimeloyl-ACP methyl ester carboxylesterase